MPVFQIRHITKYEYDHPVRESNNQIKIYPYADASQDVLSHQLTLSHEESNIGQYTDYFGNTVGVFNVLESHSELVIDSRLTVRTRWTEAAALPQNPDTWSSIAQAIGKDLRLTDFSQTEPIRAQGDIRGFLAEIGVADVDPEEAVFRCSSFIFNNFQYIKGITDVETTVDEILEHRSGVCQDFAHVLLQMLRTAGIPARYVSGYICPNKDGMRGIGATHAWVEVWLPSRGWIGVDPTNNVWVHDTHVKLAVGRHFNDCTPMKGAFKGPANQHLSVYVSVAYEDGHVSEDHNLVQQQGMLFAESLFREAGQQ